MKNELKKELNSLLDYWINRMPDSLNGGFWGRIDAHEVVDQLAPKGSVLNARILWSFSAAFNYLGEPRYLDMAHRAYHYIKSYFVDPEFGGVYWSLEASGKPLLTKKQTYAQAFTIYGMSEYYRATGFEEARADAVKLYNDLVAHSYDPSFGGYFEAFSRDWKPLDDLRLSAKDANEVKTMNTHLHVLEAFSNLYKIWPDAELKSRIIELLDNFNLHMIDGNTFHLNLFFDEGWNSRSSLVSFGHDIEAAWLLLEAARTIRDSHWVEKTTDLAIKMASAASRGLDVDGGMCYELDGPGLEMNGQKHWWVQAEAMVGFFTAWELSGDEGFLIKVKGLWSFIKNHLLDVQHGEWYWGLEKNGKLMPGEDKAGLWKCPYHNSRACMELLKKLN